MGLITQLVIGIGLLLISRLLYKPPKNANSFEDDKPTTLTNRGAYIPILLGTRKIGYVFGWAGDRMSQSTSSGGKGFGGGGSGASDWYESGWHLLCVGPATKLHAIYEDGKAIWAGPIDSTTTPSGSTVSVPGHGSFTIYWGSQDQAANAFLGNTTRVGITSGWPNVCYIVWNQKKLGTSPTWPAIEYTVTAGCPGGGLEDSNYWLSGDGINPAHAVQQLLTGKFPHGVGMAASQVDNDSLEALGELAESESHSAHILVSEGPEAARPMQAILDDTGTMMPLVDGRLTFAPIRAPSGDLPAFDDDVIAPPDTERDIDHGDERINRIIFTFKTGEADSYRDTDIKIDNDADADLSTVSTQTVTIETATDSSVASMIARRRSQALSVRGAIKIEALRAARQLVAGQAFEHPDFGVLRVTSITRNDETARVTLECSPDTYAVPDVDHEQDTYSTDSPTLAVEEDIAFAWLQVPEAISPTPAIIVLRIRAHGQIAGAGIYLSGDDASFSRAGNQDYAASGGLLEDGLADSTGDIVETGPVFEADNADAAAILDLSGDPTSWTAGKQIAIINDEVFFLESVTVQAESEWETETTYALDDVVVPTTSTGLRYICTTAGDSDEEEPEWPTEAGETVVDGTAVWTAHHYAYQMNNLIRARYDSVKGTHAADDRVFIADADSLSIIKHSLVFPGASLCVKTEPFTPAQTVDIATVDSVCGDVVGADGVNYRETSAGDGRMTTTGDIRITD